MFKSFFVVCACICLMLLSSSSVFSQETPTVPLRVGAGVVNGRATNLVKPEYSAAAKAARAAGAVNVQVLIDEEGNVVSAAATSGHPLLRAAAVEAARQSKFTPTKLSGIPVKVTGVVVYNFVGEKSSFLQIGFELVKAELSPASDNIPRLYQVRSSLPQEWTVERQLMEKLINKLRQETGSVSKSQANNAQNETKIIKESVYAIGGKVEEVQEPRQEIAAALTNSLKERLSNDEVRGWEFSIGLALGKIDAELDDDSNLRMSLNELKQLLAFAPAQASVDYVAKLKELTLIADKAEISQTDKAKIAVFLNGIK